MSKAPKKMLTLMLSIMMIFSLFVPALAATDSTDYDNHWAKSTIENALSDKIIKGYPNGDFKPDNDITRAEFFTLINKSFNFTGVSTINYTDAPADAWYYQDLAKAKAAGYALGYPDGSIRPNLFISRQEVALILSRLKPLTQGSALTPFTDAAAIAPWSKSEVNLVRGANIMIGYPDGSFKPVANIKRAEALVAVKKCLLYSNGSSNTTVPVSSLSLTENVLSLIAGGQTGLLSTIVLPSNATDQNILWTSSNPAVATVENGIVTPLTEGSAIITATSADQATLVAKATITVAKAGPVVIVPGVPVPVVPVPVVPVPVVPAPTLNKVNLGTAGNFAILSKSGISTVPPSAITGDIGVSPIDSTSLTGFSLALDATTVFATSPQITGKAYASDYTAPTPSRLTTAISDMETAYTDAAGRPSNFTELYSGDISGKTLVPGVYKWGTGVLISSDVTLNGGPNDVWIFQIGSGITQASGTKIILTGGAQAKNIFWQAAETVSIGTGAHMEGIILCQTNIALDTNASIVGRLFSQTAVTMDASTVTAP